MQRPRGASRLACARPWARAPGLRAHVVAGMPTEGVSPIEAGRVARPVRCIRPGPRRTAGATGGSVGPGPRRGSCAADGRPSAGSTASAFGRAALSTSKSRRGTIRSSLPWTQEDLGGDGRQDRPEVQTGQQVDAMGQRPDRRQAVLLEVDSPSGRPGARGTRVGCCRPGSCRRNGSRAAVPGTSRPRRKAQRSAGVNARWANPPCTAARGNRLGSRCSALSVDRRAEREPDQEGPPDVQVVDQPEQVVHEVVVGDPPTGGHRRRGSRRDSRRGSSGSAPPAG